jgi:hypothetical protein
LKATWSGENLELTRKLTLPSKNGEGVSTTVQKLSLSADGTVLTVHVHRENSPGTADRTLVFKKE